MAVATTRSRRLALALGLLAAAWPGAAVAAGSTRNKATGRVADPTEPRPVARAARPSRPAGKGSHPGDLTGVRARSPATPAVAPGALAATIVAPHVRFLAPSVTFPAPSVTPEAVGPRAYHFDGMGLANPAAPPPSTTLVLGRKATVDNDGAIRDCHGNLCGPQGFGLREGILGDPTVSTQNIFAGLGAVAGGIVLAVSAPIRAHQGAAGKAFVPETGASSDLAPAAPLLVFKPELSIMRHLAGARFVVSW
jgi:hypothetical protein